MTSRRHIPALVVACAATFCVVALALPVAANAGGHAQHIRHRPHEAVCPAQVPLGYAHCNADVVTDNSGTPLALLAPSGYGPADLWSAYRVPLDLVTGLPSGGSTQTIAIVDAFNAPTAEADMGVYRSQYGLPACTTANGCFKKVNQSGQQSNYPSNNASWAQEISLDLDMASAICPGCKILLVEASSNSLANLTTAVDRAAVMGATQISNSYGGSEYPGETNDQSHYNHPGIDITVSAGDSGYGAEFPASSQYVTAVGGTTLSRNSGVTRGWDETVWSGSGSGCSAYITKPAWQTDNGCAKRTVSDVSADADPNTGVAVYDSTAYQGASGWLVFGGTSVSSPLVASLWALAGGHSAGTAYGSYAYSHTGSFFDITSGNNGSCSGSYLCTAGVGYDGPTGIGAPAAGPSATSVAKPTVTLTTPPNGATYKQSQSVTAAYSCAVAPGAALASCNGSVANGSAIDTATTGAKSFTVTATDSTGQTTTVTNSYNVVPKPTATLTTPPNGAKYGIGQAVNASYSCSAGAGATISTCTGTVASGSAIDTASTGSKTFTVTATDSLGQTTTVTNTYSVVAKPAVAITTPPAGAKYKLGQSVAAAYSCTAGAGVTISTCTGTVANGAAIDTGTPGTKTFTVTATDSLGQTTTSSTTYSVVDKPTVTISTPADGASYQQGAAVVADYTCTAATGATISTCNGTVADGTPVDTATRGGKTFTVTATDSLGQTTTSSVSYQVVAVPVVTITAPSEGMLIHTDTAWVTFSATNSPTDFSCSLDSGPSTPCTSPATFAGLSDGAHNLVVSATNSDGSGSTAVNFSVDTSTPLEQPLTPPTGPASGAAASGPVTVSPSLVRLGKARLTRTHVVFALMLTFRLPDPSLARSACTGDVTASVGPSGQRRLTRAIGKLTASATGCRATLKLQLTPRSLGKRLAFMVSHPGNAVFEGFTAQRRIRVR